MSTSPKAGLSDNSIAALAYFTPLVAFFFLSIQRYNKRPYVRYHAWQSLVFSAFVFLIGYILSFVLPYAAYVGPPVVLWWIKFLFCLLGLVVFLIWLWCVINAFNGRRFKLPIIGNWSDEQAYR